MKGSDLISLMNTFSQSRHVWNSTDKKINPDKMYEVEYSISYGWYFNDEEYNILKEVG